MSHPHQVDSDEIIPATDPFNIRYKALAEIGEGSYSKVLKCKKRDNGEIYACKRLKHTYKNWNQVSEIPEIVTLRKLMKHPNVLQMSEIHFDPDLGRVSLVFELMDMNLYELIKDRKRLLHENRVRNMIFQLIRGLRHLHKHGIFHRDVKPENILLKRTHNEDEDILKLGDLGSVRGLYSRPPYTEYISTRWYRSPECLMTAGYYSIKMDIWATGCVFYEVLTLRPLFPGSSEVDQINRIHNIVGPPPQKILQKFVKHAEENRNLNRHHKQVRFDNIKKTLENLTNDNSGQDGTNGVDRLLPNHISPEARDLLSVLLQYDPELRPTAHRALAHPYFKGLREAARKSMTDMMPSEVIVSIGKSVKKLSELDGTSPDLRTLGDLKPKRSLREVPSKIPIPIKVPSQTSKTTNINISTSNSYSSNSNVRKSVDNRNVEQRKREAILLQKEEPKGKKIKSYDEFAQKSKQSLPYEIVHIDKYDKNNNEDISLYRVHESNPSTTTSSKLEESPYKLKETTSTLPTKKSIDREFVDGTNLSPAALRRINENRRRLVQLYPIGNQDKEKLRDSTFSNKDLKRTMSKMSVPKLLVTKVSEEDLSDDIFHTPIRRKNSTMVSSNASNEGIVPKLNILRERNLTPKKSFPREFVDGRSLNPAALRRINENRRLVQLDPIGSKDKLEVRQDYGILKTTNSRVIPKPLLTSKESLNFSVLADKAAALIESPLNKKESKDNFSFKDKTFTITSLGNHKKLTGEMSRSPPSFPLLRKPLQDYEHARLAEDEDDIDIFHAPIRRKNFARASEGILPRLKKPSEQMLLTETNSYYPSLHGRIRVSKPSLLRTPPLQQPPPVHSTLHPPPLLRQADKTPFSFYSRESQKFLRETVTKKKYSFLHEKQDLLFSTNKKSKLK